MPNNEGNGVRAIDVHAHFFPQEYLDVLAEEGPRFQVEYRAAPEGFYIKTEARFQGPLPYRAVDLEKRIADMDAQGTTVQAMSLTGPMAHWGDEEVSHKLARAWNDAASAAHLKYPTRLVGLLTLPMLFPDRAVDELNRASKLPGVRGVYMGTNINHRDLDDPLFEPIFAPLRTASCVSAASLGKATSLASSSKMRSMNKFAPDATPKPYSPPVSGSVSPVAALPATIPAQCVPWP